MNPAILIVVNLVLFCAFAFGVLVACSYLTRTVIGFYYGGRLASFTPEDAISQRKHNRLMVSVAIATFALSGLLFWALGSETWSCFVLSPTLAGAIAIFLSFKSDRRRLLPYGWPSR